jgi:glycosyltransferase involved in cell wall biosynthesis
VGDLTTDRKGVDVAIDALRSLPELRCRLTVIGGGRVLPELQRRADVDPRIRFIGPQPPAFVRDALLATDIVLFPTRADVFGLVVVEAMGAGVATVISKAAGAAADLAVSEQNSLVIDGMDIERWAGALRRLVENADFRRLLGENARRTIARRWTLDHSADAMIAGLRLGVLAQRAS